MHVHQHPSLPVYMDAEDDENDAYVLLPADLAKLDRAAFDAWLESEFSQAA